MREIKEKARSFLNHGAEINRHKLIHDLLAELERVENSREAECMECEKLACVKINQIISQEYAKTIDELVCQKNACQQVISERDQRIDELEAENARLKADLSGSFFVDQIKEKARQQAAREAVEIIDKYPAFLFGTDAVGVKLNLSQSIKARFGLDG